jgi:hypothetical protein
MASSDEPPTRRESAQLAVFEQTVTEALVKLAAIPDPPDDRTTELRIEGEQLQRIFANWRTDPPIGEERTQTIERVMDLHRSVESLLAESR